MEKFQSESEGMPLNNIRRKAFNDFNEAIFQGIIKINNIETCFCSSQKFQQLSRLERFGLPFGTQICKACGLITQTKRIDVHSMPFFYEEIYWPLVIGLEGGFLTPAKEDEVEPYILQFVDSKKSHLKLFEIGCGSGTRISSIAQHLSEQDFSVAMYGCDYSSEALSLAKTKGINTIHGGMEELQTFGKADILILSHVFEHFTDLGSEMENLHSLIGDDSLIYIEVPGVNDLPNKKEYLYDYQMYNVLAHTYNFSLRSLTNVLGKGGFELIKGDEFVRSVFKKSQTETINFQIQSAYDETIEALKLAKIKRDKFMKLRSNKIYLYVISILKSLLGRYI